MIQEVVKICGLDLDSIRLKLREFLGMGVTFDIEEKCLDAKITMTSAGTRESFDQIKSYVYNTFSEQVYATEDTSLHALAVAMLKRTKKVLSVAESLTGGEICSRLTSVPGVSENFYEGIVCYNRHSKMDRLGIPRAFIGEYGTVSRETAHAMVKGLIANKKVDLGLATTGLAGPTGDEGKPVGLVYIAVGGGDFITTFEKRLSGDRNQIREATANLALFYLVRYLRGDILLL